MHTDSSTPGIAAGRLSGPELARNFCDAHPPMNLAQARIEADRCYYCYDAPCQSACPTGIDVPSFIQRIADGNLRGAAHTILEANPLGGMCARVCPTEVLCEQACVRNTQEDKPVEIGQLQRYATDHLMAHPGKPLFTRAATSGKRVAVVGAGAIGGVWIGLEHPHPALRECAVVQAPYRTGNGGQGQVALVGPMRMAYATARAAVQSVATILQQLLG